MSGLCFTSLHGSTSAVPVSTTVLPQQQAQAFADLLPLLVCGEESAALAFDGLARRCNYERAEALTHIASEERGHDALLAGVRAGLPVPQGSASSRLAVRRFYLLLQERDPDRHLARITALDSAACTILAALTRFGHGVSADITISARLRRIQREESGHVRLGLAFCTIPGSQRAPIQEETRAGLAALLEPFADRFETLAIDADALFSTIRAVPGALRR